ncbi:MAG: pentapeptide repeat-containing protein [Stackebrandtia sp.]
MTKKPRPRPANPAAPQLSRAGVPADFDDRPLRDEEQWHGLDFSGAAAPGETVEGFEAEQCRLDRVDFSGAVWRRGVWRDCRFSDANLANVHAEGCAMRRCEASTVRGTGLQWTDGVMADVVFSGCRLDMAGFRFSRFNHVVFDDCRMTACDFTEADLSGTRFVGCDLTGARFHHASAPGVRFDNCVLEDVTGVEYLRGAAVAGPDLAALTHSMAAALGIEVVAVNPDR